jgi:hypothetical protein
MKKRNRDKIIRELPAIGTALEGKFKGIPYKAKIVKDESSPKKRAILYNGKLFPSMTAAAEAITKQPTNGWRFWNF